MIHGGPGKRLAGGAFVLLAVLVAGASAAKERGFRPIRTFGSEEWSTGSQCFAVTQDGRGRIYIGNLGGVLVYDGARWRAIPTKNGSAVRSLAVDAHGRVAVGGFHELGYLEPDAKGHLSYVSLVPLLPPAQRDLLEVPLVHAEADGFLFVSKRRALLWQRRELRQVATLSDDDAAFELGDSVVVWSPEAGLRRLGDDGLSPFPGGERLKGRPVEAAVSLGGGRALLAVRDEGLFVHDAAATTRFAPQASAWLRGKRISTAIRLVDGRLAIGTRGAGLLLLGPGGEMDEVLDATAGLEDEGVVAAYQAVDGSLWLALEGGTARVEIASPITLLDARLGPQGDPRCVARLAGALYVGTRTGLFVFESEPATRNAPRAARVPGIASTVWALLPEEDSLLAASDGLYEVRGGRAREIAGTSALTAYVVAASPSDPRRVWVGLREGLGAVRLTPKGPVFEGLVAGISSQVRSIVEERPGVLWLGTTLDGALRVELKADGRLARATRYGEKEVSCFRVAGRVLFLSENGISRFDEASGTLVPDHRFGTISPAFRAVEDSRGGVWFNTRPPTYARPGAGGVYVNDERLLVGMPGSDVQGIEVEPDGVVWFCTEKGLVRYDPRLERSAAPPPVPLVSRVIQGRELEVHAGSETSAPPDIAYTRARLRFDCAPLSYEPGVLYQFRLDPSDSEWSDWGSESWKEYTNLWEGRYAFRVRTKSRTGGVSPEAVFRFRVLPPWFRTTTAYASYVIAAALLLAASFRLRHRVLRRKNEILRARVAERTQDLAKAVEELAAAKRELEDKNVALEVANSRLEALSFRDALTGIANRRRLEEVLADEWARAWRSGAALSFVIADIDHFKDLNDRRGHPAGDACLKRIAEALRASLKRSGDLPARYGGEEFAVVLPSTDLTGAARLAETMRRAIESLAIAHEGSPFGVVTASFGAAEARPRDGSSPAELVAAADRALYAAKAAGRNRVAIA